MAVIEIFFTYLLVSRLKLLFYVWKYSQGSVKPVLCYNTCMKPTSVIHLSYQGKLFLAILEI